MASRAADRNVVAGMDLAAICGVALVDALALLGQVDAVLDGCAAFPRDATIPSHAGGEAGAPRLAIEAKHAVLPPGGLGIALVRVGRVLRHADERLGVLDAIRS